MFLFSTGVWDTSAIGPIFTGFSYFEKIIKTESFGW
jgi:hypothetical protein